jgi:3-oxoadipate enol-lactonase
MLQRLHAHGIDLAYRIDEPSGAPPWVVMSHSLACDHTMWDSQMRALRDFRVLRFDTRGHGAFAA